MQSDGIMYTMVINYITKQYKHTMITCDNRANSNQQQYIGLQVKQFNYKQ